MAELPGHPRWRRQLRDASALGRGVLGEATRWQRVEVDLLRMAACGLALALPIAVGILAGRTGEGMVASLGALTVSSSGQVGSARTRARELALSGAAGGLGALFGVAFGSSAVTGSVIVVGLAVLAVAVGSVRPSLTKASVQFVVFMIIGATLAATGLSDWKLIGLMLGGALTGGLLTLLAYGTGRAVRGSAAVLDPPRRSWTSDLAAWRGLMGSLAGWHYPLRLGSCMALAEVLAHRLHGHHSYWILLTVVLVVQRDHVAALTRTLQRAVGTALGVVLGALLVNTIPIWAMVAVVAAVGAVRVHLKAANYAAYTLVMTPLVTVLSGLGGPISSALLRERLVDTVLGCLISLLLGYLVWRRIRWTE